MFLFLRLVVLRLRLVLSDALDFDLAVDGCLGVFGVDAGGLPLLLGVDVEADAAVDVEAAVAGKQVREKLLSVMDVFLSCKSCLSYGFSTSFIFAFNRYSYSWK